MEMDTISAMGGKIKGFGSCGICGSEFFPVEKREILLSSPWLGGRGNPFWDRRVLGIYDSDVLKKVGEPTRIDIAKYPIIYICPKYRLALPKGFVKEFL